MTLVKCIMQVCPWWYKGEHDEAIERERKHWRQYHEGGD